MKHGLTPPWPEGHWCHLPPHEAEGEQWQDRWPQPRDFREAVGCSLELRGVILPSEDAVGVAGLSPQVQRHPASAAPQADTVNSHPGCGETAAQEGEWQVAVTSTAAILTNSTLQAGGKCWYFCCLGRNPTRSGLPFLSLSPHNGQTVGLSVLRGRKVPFQGRKRGQPPHRRVGKLKPKAEGLPGFPESVGCQKCQTWPKVTEARSPDS